MCSGRHCERFWSGVNVQIGVRMREERLRRFKMWKNEGKQERGMDMKEQIENYWGSYRNPAGVAERKQYNRRH